MNKAMNKVIKSHIVLACISFVAVALIATGVTYSLFQVDKENTTNQNITIGNLSAKLNSIEGAVVLNDLYPTLSTELTMDDKIYNFSILNDGDYDVQYEIYLKDATDSLLQSSSDYTEYKRFNKDYYKYINFIFDEGATKNLDSTKREDKFIMLKGTLKPGESFEHKIQFFVDKGETTENGAPNDLAGSVLSLDIYMDATALSGEELVNALLEKANGVAITDYETGNKGEMYTFSHDATAQTEALTDYRYIGNMPNNYIEFNAEMWRIIGVFTVEGENGEKEQRVKIIREEPIGDLAWNDNDSNEWPSSSLYAVLNTGDYYNRRGIYNSNGLTGLARDQIAASKWYLGGNNNSSLDGSAIYNFERGNTVSSGHSTNTVEKVGLLYPSDYIYTYAYGVDNTCFQDGSNCSSGTPSNSWLSSTQSLWTITPNSSNMTTFGKGNNHNLDHTYNILGNLFVKPTTYLRSDIRILSGTGEESNPYKLCIDVADSQLGGESQLQ